MKFKMLDEPKTLEEAERQIFYLNCLYENLSTTLKRIDPRTPQFEDTVNNLYEIKKATREIRMKKARMEYEAESGELPQVEWWDSV